MDERTINFTDTGDRSAFIALDIMGKKQYLADGAIRDAKEVEEDAIWPKVWWYN